MADLEPEGFPDIFVFTLRDLLKAELSNGPHFTTDGWYTRALRPEDPSRSVGILEETAQPHAYEMAGVMDPSMLTWDVQIQVLSKHSNEVEGRNVRRRLLQGVRRALFLPTTTQALMTLNDGFERVSKYNLRSIDFDGAELRGKNNAQFFFLGTVDVTFHTDKL